MHQHIALVTGATRGIGLEVCRQLGKKKIKVILTGRHLDACRNAASMLEQEGLDVAFCQLDITDQKSIDRCYDWVKTEFGRLDILINNAGIAIDQEKNGDWDHPEKTYLINAKIDAIQTTIETNTYGPIRMIQKFAPLMKENGYGRIVNVSSEMGQLSEMSEGWIGYRLSKTALNAVTCVAASELFRSDILVNSVCPGWVKTDMGGPKATLSVEEGADTITWLATLPKDGPTGGFFKKRQSISW